MRLNLFVLFFLSSSFLPAHANISIRFVHYDHSHGLSHNSIRHIVQDNTGYIWVGTFGGLNRFDGYQFKPFLSSDFGDNRLHNNDITALIYDEIKEQFWIGTRKGLTKYQVKDQRFITYLAQVGKPNSITDNEIRAIYIDRFERVWIGTKSKGLFLFDQQSEEFSQVVLEGYDYIKVIYGDSKGHIWVGSYDSSGIAKISMEKNGQISNIKHYNLSTLTKKETNPYIYFIYEDAKSDVFAGTRKGLYKWNIQKDRFEIQKTDVKENRSLMNSHFMCVARSPLGKYWVGTLNGLIECEKIEDISLGRYKLYESNLSDKTSLTDNLVASLYFDKSGVLWVGTENGLDKYDPFENQFKTLKGISGIVGNKAIQFSGFAETYDNSLLIATHNHGLFQKTENSFNRVKTSKSNISSIYTIDGNIFYCGLWDGKLLIYDYQKKLDRIVDIGFEEVPVMSFCNIKKNQLLIGSFGQGAVLLYLNTETVDNSFQKLTKDLSINHMVSNATGKIWMGTETGVRFFNPENNQIVSYFSSQNDSLGQLYENVSDVYIDVNGKVWAGTRLGLCYFDPRVEDFILVTDVESIKNQWVTDIVEDTKGYLWLNLNNNKIVRYNPQKNEERTYRVNNGSRLDVFTSSDLYFSKNKIIYLGGKEGVIEFAPEELMDNKVALKPFVTEFRVHNKIIEVGEKIDGQIILKQNINTQKNIHLSYSNRNFSITFSSPSYVNENGNRFLYRLVGFNEDWNIADVFHRTVQYTNLKPGDYIFQVKALNSHAYWSEIASYNFHIQRPKWLNLYAVLSYFLLFTILVLFFRRVVRQRINLKHELILEKVKREKDERLNKDKLRFFTNISHELRTPLTLILGPVKQLLKNEANSSNASSYQLIYKNTIRLLTLVNQILDFRKVQQGTLKLKVTETDIKEVSLNTFNSFQAMASEKRINYIFSCTEEKLIGWVDRDKYDKILYNLLSNAFKFTPQSGKIELLLEFDNQSKDTLKVSVTDNGLGIPYEEQKKIFTRFYQAKNTLQDNTGTGIGLSVVESMVNVHKGKVWFTSTEGKGSLFSFTVPLEKTEYAENEIFDFSGNVKVNFTEDLKAPSGTVINLDIKEKLLIIEDNAELRDFLKNYLSHNFDVYESENGKEGLEQCLSLKPMICIVDVMMPIMNGLEFCSTLKNNDEISHIPVLLLTALNEDENKIKGYKAGADAYIGKPFDPELLLATIQSIVDNRKSLKYKFSSDTGSDVKYVTHSPADETFLTKLKDFIEKNISDSEFFTKDMSNHMNVSSSKLYRKIKELTDMSPNEFLRAMRLKKASELLKSHAYNVSEVATMVGFNDPLYFSRCFKKQFGVSPKGYLS
jgi:signal transduction histidine kinase/ligand-binding sensor domain-containing protein/DNA-binding response OmpR family regulator